jgi:hypothetical protein
MAPGKINTTPHRERARERENELEIVFYTSQPKFSNTRTYDILAVETALDQWRRVVLRRAAWLHQDPPENLQIRGDFEKYQKYSLEELGLLPV